MEQHTEHFRRIETLLTTAPASDWRAASWSRCIGKYKLDPARPKIVELTKRELKLENELFAEELAAARAELENALLIIQEGGYSAYITNRNGTILAERRCQDAVTQCNTDRIGAVWSEDIGGTNAIGTSILSLQPIAVFLSDHFFADFTPQACAAAPVFDPDGDLLGVINLSTRNPALQESTNRMVLGVAMSAARRLESKYFAERYKRQYVFDLSVDGWSPASMAVDEDFQIVGATRNARNALSLSDGAVGSRSLWALFAKTGEDLRPESFCQRNLQLRLLGTSRTVEVRGRRPLELKSQSGVRSNGFTPKREKTQLPSASLSLEDCIGQDTRMRKSVDLLYRVMGSGLHILLLGETGVGKDTLARALHESSNRSTEAFVAFNCSAMPDSLIDSELFGYSPGAFTGANRTGSSGRIIEADGGTLFLDEIGDMPLLLQTRLLRFLETQEVTPLGSGKTRFVDVQVIAATNQDLNRNVEAGRFRRDLLHRLAGAVVSIPPLREREDIDLLVARILAQCSQKRRMKLSREAGTLLQRHPWPGNIRELRNVIRRAVQLADDEVIETEHLTMGGMFFDGSFGDGGASTQLARTISPVLANNEQRIALTDQPHPVVSAATVPPDARGAISIAEKAVLASTIEQSHGDAERCASLLGISRATLYRKLKRHGLSLR